MVKRHGPPKRWYERHDFAQDRLVAPWHRTWWLSVWWQYVAGPFFRALVWDGCWEVKEGYYYTAGRWRFGELPRGSDVQRELPGWSGFWRYVSGRWG